MRKTLSFGRPGTYYLYILRSVVQSSPSGCDVLAIPEVSQAEKGEHHTRTIRHSYLCCEMGNDDVWLVFELDVKIWS